MDFSQDFQTPSEAKSTPTIVFQYHHNLTQKTSFDMLMLMLGELTLPKPSMHSCGQGHGQTITKIIIC
jgi:hypothetical protein